jgi:hypothetical protein
MTLRKAAEMALDALDIYREHDAENIGLADAAYEALRQALAQSEQEPFIYVREDNERPFGGYEHCSEVDAGAFPVYTAPPKRKWVGLTDDELKALCHEWQIIYGGYVRPFAETIEAKLKEKNT